MIGRSLAYRFVGDVVVLVHGNCLPDPHEFDDWLEQVVSRRPVASLVVTPGPGPSPAQRKHMLSRLREAKLTPPTAIVTDSTLARGIVTALRWFQEYELQAFSPNEMGKAIAFVAPAPQHDPLRVAVQEMQRALLRAGGTAASA